MRHIIHICLICILSINCDKNNEGWTYLFDGESLNGWEMKIAGYELKKTVLELGGNDPYLIFSDADLVESAKAAIDGRILNAGQSCIAAKRIIIVDKIYNYFLNNMDNNQDY